MNMAQLTIALGRDPTSGKRIIRVALRSDADTSAFEHESDHRRLVAALSPSGADVQRERPDQEPIVG
jgi:hypothetical protein